MSPHPVVAEMVAAYLELADAEAPTLVEGLYLVGSAALDDFRPGASDVDFVAVTAAPLDAVRLAALRRVHDRLRRRRRRPYFDGAYLTWADLTRDPAGVAPGAGSHEGRFHPTGAARDPVTWHTLARYGIVCRGPQPAELEIWADPRSLAAWTDNNLDAYWRGWLRRGSRLWTPRGVFAGSQYAAVWAVTGVSRLHYTLATGDITSKVGAALHALDAFPPRWQPVLTESLRLRRGEPGPSLYRTPLERRRDVLAFTDLVIDAGHRLYAAQAH